MKQGYSHVGRRVLLTTSGNLFLIPTVLSVWLGKYTAFGSSSKFFTTNRDILSRFGEVTGTCWVSWRIVVSIFPDTSLLFGIWRSLIRITQSKRKSLVRQFDQVQSKHTRTMVL